MPTTTTFNITASADDQMAFSTNPTVYASLAYSSHFSAGGILAPHRGKSGANYENDVVLLRFNTSALPDNAIVTAATLRFYVNSKTNIDSRNLIADYYTWNGTSSDWTSTAPASPVLSATLASLTTLASNDIALTDFSGISKTGNTSLRLHVSGGVPTGINEVAINSYDGTSSPKPQLIVTYNTGLLPTAGFSYTTSSLIANFTDSSTDPDGTIASRSWDFGDGASSTATNPSHTYSSGGTYTVVLTVTDNDGNTDTETQSVTVTANISPTASFTYSGTGLTRSFTDASTDPDGTIASRLWTFDDGTTSTATNPSHTWASAGTYIVELTVTDNQGATGSTQQSITVSQAGAGTAYLSRYIPARESALAVGMNTTQTTVVLSELAYWPATGEAIIDFEKITWTGKSAPSGQGSITGVSRGAFGTSPTAHAIAAPVYLLNRHDSGILTQRLIPLFPVNASITLQELRRHSDSQRFVWADFDNFLERAELDLTDAPTSSGNVSVTLDEGGTPVTHTSAVTVTKEVRSLTINNPQTTEGDISVTLDGATKVLTPSGGREKWQVEILSTAETGGIFRAYWLYVPPVGSTESGLADIEFFKGDSPSQIAARVRDTPLTDWTISGTGSTIIYEKNAPGPISSFQFSIVFRESRNIMPSSAQLTALSTGTKLLSAAEIAGLIGQAPYPGWETSRSSATVTFTAVEAGPKAGAFSYSAGATGATSTSGLTQTTAGAATSLNTIASNIRTLYSGNTYWTVGGAGPIVSWLATSTGSKLDATFSSGGTNTKGTMQTTQQGSPDIVASIQDSSGVQIQRRVLANLTTSQQFYLETCVSGAGTEKAVVSVWGAFGSNPLKLLWRVTDVDLSEHPLGEIAYGVIAESATGLTWDVHTDEVEPTDRGRTYYHDHDAIGNWMNQAHYYGRLETPQARNDLYIQDLSIPVIPGEEVVMAAKLRYENVPSDLPAKPLFVTAHHADGTTTDLRDVTGTTGISGTMAWAEPTPYTFSVPLNCYEIRVASRDMSGGTIAIQQLVVSPGTLPKRTYYYATNGTVTVRYDGRTPQETNALRLGRKRTALETQYDKLPGTLTSEQYRSADDPDSFEDVWYPNPADVLDRPVVETEVTLEGDGLSTPQLLSGFPRYEYKLQVGLQDQPILNKPDGAEFPGMVVLDKREEWHPNTGIDVRVLPSGRVRRGKTHEPVGYIPKLSLWAFRPESVKYLMEKWGTEELIADWVDDEVLTLKLLSSPEFERQHGTRDGTGSGSGRAAEWKSKEIAAEVVSVRKRITP